jgi:hypothetical protein
MGTESVLCDECGRETVATDWCDGSCFDYKLDWLDEALEEWSKANGDPLHIRILGKRMGWQSRSGYKLINANRKELLDALTFSGSWTLELDFNGVHCNVTRWSHDEPTGASFELLPDRLQCDACGYADTDESTFTVTNDGKSYCWSSCVPEGDEE